jgi:hypothetical protein
MLENKLDARRHWLRVRLIGTHANRDAVGAIVRIRSAAGREQSRHVKGGGSYASTGDRRLAFGLGDDGSPVELTILWPGGTEVTLTDVPADREIVVSESRGETTVPN